MGAFTGYNYITVSISEQTFAYLLLLVQAELVGVSGLIELNSWWANSCCTPFKFPWLLKNICSRVNIGRNFKTFYLINIFLFLEK